MSTVNEYQKLVARHTAQALSVEKPRINSYWDDSERSSVFILEAIDRPQDGVKTYATVGLSEYPVLNKGKEIKTRVELIGVSGSDKPDYANLLSTAAFCIINSGWFCAPGIIFPDVVSMYLKEGSMSDLYFTYPFLWEQTLSSSKLEGNDVAWLLAVPISKAETKFAQENGPEKLEELFASNNIDIFDINRSSII